MGAAGSRERRTLNRDAIVDAALALIDDQGIDGLTMRRLGDRLGVDPMAVYRHFPNKGAVLDGVMERIWASVDIAGTAHDARWQERLAVVMHGLRRALLAHPRAISIVGTRPASGPGLFLLMEQIMGELVDAGLRIDDTSADLMNALVNYTVGHVLAEAGDAVGGNEDQHSNLLVVPDRFPNLAAVFNSGWQYDAHRQFDRALRSMIDGWPLSAPSTGGTA
ncbi:MAG: TetR/AcrR family transcriptional regulator C-terminal domain-containing protein [Arachnia sp.]